MRCLELAWSVAGTVNLAIVGSVAHLSTIALLGRLTIA